jgi:hypothetical protein
LREGRAREHRRRRDDTHNETETHRNLRAVDGGNVSGSPYVASADLA